MHDPVAGGAQIEAGDLLVQRALLLAELGDLRLDVAQIVHRLFLPGGGQAQDLDIQPGAVGKVGGDTGVGVLSRRAGRWNKCG